MRRKYGDRAGWARILEHTFTVARVERPAFCGVVTLYTMRRVREPLFKPVVGKLTRIADDGFRWLQLYSAHPAAQTCTVTATYNAESALAQWYIDVCAGHGIDHTGIPWHDDLYLDLVVSPGADLEVIDGVELEVAADTGEIDAAYTLAWREAHRIAPPPAMPACPRCAWRTRRWKPYWRWSMERSGRAMFGLRREAKRYADG